MATDIANIPPSTSSGGGGGAATLPSTMILADATTATQPDLLVLRHTTSGIAAAGFGGTFAVELQSAGGTTRRALTDITKWTTATDTAEVVTRNWSLMKAGALVVDAYTFGPDTLTMVSQTGKLSFASLASIAIDSTFFDLNLVAFGDTVVGAPGALATTAVRNFLDIPTCAGTPTGICASLPSGKVALVYDTTANKLWVSAGSGTWKSAAYT